MQLLHRHIAVNHRRTQRTMQLSRHRHRVMHIRQPQGRRNNLIQADIDIRLLLTVELRITVDIQSLACNTAAVLPGRQAQLQPVMLADLRIAADIMQNKAALLIIRLQHRVLQKQLDIWQALRQLQMPLVSRQAVQLKALRRLFGITLKNLQAHPVVKAKMHIRLMQLNLFDSAYPCLPQHNIPRLDLQASLRHLQQRFATRRLPAQLRKINIAPNISTQLLRRHASHEHLLLMHKMIKNIRRLPARLLRQEKVRSQQHQQQRKHSTDKPCL